MRRRSLVLGALCGVLAVFAGRILVNGTPVADWVVSPLLLTDTGGTADAIVVPGAGVVGPCLSNGFGVRRVLLSAQLWRRGRAPIVVYTGGTGRSTCPVAEAMAHLAREVGVPASAIIVESFSRNTWENAERSAVLLRTLGIRRVIVVTDRLHMLRATGVFSSLGFETERVAVPIYAAHADNVDMLRAGLREFAALAYYRWRGWLQPPDQLLDVKRVENVASSQSSHVAHPEGPIVLLGASYAGSWTIAHVEGVPVINRGIGGDRSSDMLGRFEPDVVAARPRAVILWGFINDITRSTSQDLEGTLAGTRDAYVEMVKLARQHGIEPILATEVTMGPVGSSWKETLSNWLAVIRRKESYQDRVNRNVMTINRWLVEFAAREQLQLLDLQAVLSAQNTLRRAEFTQDDGSHITPRGYEALTEYVTPVLARILQASPRESLDQ